MSCDMLERMAKLGKIHMKGQGTKEKMNSISYTIGYNKDNIPVKLYFDNHYLNDRLEFAIDSKTWKVYIYKALVGYVTDDGRVCLNEEGDENENKQL